MDTEYRPPDLPSVRLRLRLRVQASSSSGLSQARNEIPWNAARCNRYLRAITSRVELLRKDWDLSRNKAPAERLSKTGKEATKEKAGGVPSDKINVTDEAWEIIQQRTRRLVQTYSARPNQKHGQRRVEPRRGATGQQKSVPPGQIIVAIPILNRSHSFTPTNESGVREPYARAVKRIKSLRGSAMGVPSSTWGSSYVSNLCLGIGEALYRLLRDSSNRAAPRSTGARSLFSTCLRQVPNFLKEEERRVKECATEDERDAAMDSGRDPKMDIYADLENARSTSNEGWKPLGEVVRAHGVSIIRDAILDGLLHQQFVKKMILLCADHDAFDEAEILLDALIEITVFPRMPPSVVSDLHDSKVSFAFSVLDAFVQVSGRQGFRYRQLTRLLRADRLAPEWFITAGFGFSFPWDEVIHSVMFEENDHHLDALHFMEAAISLSLRSNTRESRLKIGSEEQSPNGWTRSSEPSYQELADAFVERRLAQNDLFEQHILSGALDHKVISLLEALSAISLLGDEAHGSAGQPRAGEKARIICRLLMSLSISIQQNIVQCGVNIFKRTYSLRRVIPVLFTSVILCQGDSTNLLAGSRISPYQACSLLSYFVNSELDGSQIDYLIHRGRAGAIHGLASMISGIVASCRRVAKDDMSYVKTLMERLLSMVEDPSVPDYLSSEDQDILRRIISCTIRKLPCDPSNQGYDEWYQSLRAKYASDHAQAPNKQNTLTINGGSTVGSLTGWEDDLCERLANTPAISSRKRRKGSDASVSDEDTPGYQARFAKGGKPGNPASNYPKLSTMLLGSSPGTYSPHPKRMFAPLPAPPTFPAGLTNEQDESLNVIGGANAGADDVESVFSPIRRIPTRTLFTSFGQMQNNMPNTSGSSSDMNSLVQPNIRRNRIQNKIVNGTITRYAEDIAESDGDVSAFSSVSKSNPSVRLTDLKTENKSTHSVPKVNSSIDRNPSLPERIVGQPLPKNILHDVTNRRTMRAGSLPKSTSTGDLVDNNLNAGSTRSFGRRRVQSRTLTQLYAAKGSSDDESDQ